MKSQSTSITLLLLSALCLASVSAQSHCLRKVPVTAGSAGVTFYPGDCVVGDPHGCHLVFESNCNLVLYNKNIPLWASATTQEDNDECRAIFQSDGNLVVYSQVSSDAEVTEYSNGEEGLTEGVAIWSSGSWTQIEGAVLQISDDHHLQIVQIYNGNYTVTIDVSNPPDHETPRPFRTSDDSTISVKITDDYDFIFQEQQYVGSLDSTNLILQDDCNFVLYNEEGPQWASGSVRNKVYNCQLALTREGALKMYASDDPSVVYWSWDGTSALPGDLIWTEVTVENGVMEITYVVGTGFTVTFDTSSGSLQPKQ